MMISNEGKEFCRTIGLTTERIICLADYYDDTLGRHEKSLFYDPRYEDKENIIADMKEAAKEIEDTVKHIGVSDLTMLYQEHGISLTEYSDGISFAVFAETYSNRNVRNQAKALEEIVIDMIYLELKDDAKYKKIAEGECENNDQSELLPQ